MTVQLKSFDDNKEFNLFRLAVSLVTDGAPGRCEVGMASVALARVPDVQDALFWNHAWANGQRDLTAYPGDLRQQIGNCLHGNSALIGTFLAKPANATRS